MKPDEKLLLKTLLVKTKEARRRKEFINVREIVNELGMSEKRAEYLLDKWSSKDWFEYGVSPMAGWLTDKGIAEAYLMDDDEDEQLEKDAALKQRIDKAKEEFARGEFVVLDEQQRKKLFGDDTKEQQ